MVPLPADLSGGSAFSTARQCKSHHGVVSAPDFARIVLRDYPIDVWQRTQQHYDELLREFAHIINLSPADRSHEVPAQLIALIEALRAGYAQMSSAAAGLRERAANEGRTTVD